MTCGRMTGGVLCCGIDMDSHDVMEDYRNVRQDDKRLITLDCGEGSSDIYLGTY